MFGWGYVKDTCIALFKKEQEEIVYKKYITECLRLITENTAGMVHGQFMSKSYSDIINPKPQTIQEAGYATEKIRAKLR